MASEILTRLLNYWNNKPSSQIFARLGEELYKSGQRSRALEILREGIEKYPGYITGYIVLATCLFENDLIDEAEITARMANQLDPNNLVVLNLLADIAYRKRELETGLSYLDNILAIDPTNEAIRDKLARWQEEFRGTVQPTPPPESLEEEKRIIEREVAKAELAELFTLTETLTRIEKPPEKEEKIEPEAIPTTMPEEKIKTAQAPAEEKVVEPIEEEKPEIVAEEVPAEEIDLGLKANMVLPQIEETEEEIQKKRESELEPEERISETMPKREGLDEGISIENLEGIELMEEGLKLTPEEHTAFTEEDKPVDESGLDKGIVEEEIGVTPLVPEDNFVYMPEGEEIEWDKITSEALEKIEELELTEFSLDEELVKKPQIPITPTMAEVYASQGNFKKAYEIYLQLINLTNNPDEKKLYEKRLSELRELIPPDQI